MLVERRAQDRRPRPGRDDDVPGLAVRRIAADILEGVLRRRRPLDELLDTDARASPRWPSATARWRARWSRPCCAGSAPCAICSALLERGLPPQAPRVETALLIGAAQILFLDVPDHAAVDLSVRLVQADRHAARYAGLVNAVLRRIAREGAARSPRSTRRRSTRPNGCWRAGSRPMARRPRTPSPRQRPRSRRSISR